MQEFNIAQMTRFASLSFFPVLLSCLPMLAKRIFTTLLVLTVLAGATRVYFRATDDFRLGNITHPMPFQAAWEIPPLSPTERKQIEAILDQKFSYIGKGAQAYAFGSEDGKYVLKFFKFKHLRPNSYSSWLPSFIPAFKAYKENLAIRKNRKLYGVFEGYRLAYGVHKEGSGILFLQLNPAQNLNRTATLIDKIGFNRRVDLNTVPFILQEKARTTRAEVITALSNGNVGRVTRLIGQIFELYLEEYRKGVYDKDHGVMHNTGFVGDRPIHLDIGKLTKEESLSDPEFWERDLEIIAWKFATWTRETYPEQASAVERGMEEKLSKIFKRPFAFATSTPPLRKRRH